MWERLRNQHKTLIRVVLTVFLCGAGNTRLIGGEPTDQVKSTIDRLLAVLDDPNLADPDRLREVRVKLAKIADERIDWERVCRSSLGRHWKDRTEAEKKRFILLMSEFLELTYANSVITSFGNLKKMEYKNERIDGHYAFVRVEATTLRNTRHPVDYTLRKKSADSEWEVIDIVIEGASLVKNYRTQFDGVIRRSGFSGLLEELQKRLEEKRANLPVVEARN